MRRFAARPASALIALATLAPAGVALAHPHTYTDQQVQLSIALDRVGLGVAILPSADAGPILLARLDRDGDRAVAPGEAAAFAAEVLAAATLAIDGRAIALGEFEIRMPCADALASGADAIRMTAAARFAPLDAGAHEIAFAIRHDTVSPDWFVQPHYHRDLIDAAGTPTLERSADGGSIRIRFELR